jgi:hypothetical protein
MSQCSLLKAVRNDEPTGISPFPPYRGLCLWYLRLESPSFLLAWISRRLFSHGSRCSLLRVVHPKRVPDKVPDHPSAVIFFFSVWMTLLRVAGAPSSPAFTLLVVYCSVSEWFAYSTLSWHSFPVVQSKIRPFSFWCPALASAWISCHMSPSSSDTAVSRFGNLSHFHVTGASAL